MAEAYEDAKKERKKNDQAASIDMIWKFVLVALLASNNVSRCFSFGWPIDPIVQLALTLYIVNYFGYWSRLWDWIKESVWNEIKKIPYIGKLLSWLEELSSWSNLLPWNWGKKKPEDNDKDK